jgi:hypothetical protein
MSRNEEAAGVVAGLCYLGIIGIAAVSLFQLLD